MTPFRSTLLSTDVAVNLVLRVVAVESSGLPIYLEERGRDYMVPPVCFLRAAEGGNADRIRYIFAGMWSSDLVWGGKGTYDPMIVCDTVLTGSSSACWKRPGHQRDDESIHTCVIYTLFILWSVL